MKLPPALLLSGVILFAGTSLATEQDSLQEKIDDPSPDKKFAVRTTYDSSINDGSGEQINNESIRSVDVIALADKKVVANLLSGDGESHIAGHIKWSTDSKWLTYAESEGHRVTETSVFHWQGDKFEGLNTEQLNVPAGGDPRNQYITPVRWLKPGTLVLEQYTIFRGGEGDSNFEFTVRFDQSGKFHVINRKKVKHKDE